jgi:ribosome biogenesis GTPase / thiamine phosphate phosphatase
MRATVYETSGGVYRVLLDSGDWLEASLRGRLKRQVRTGDRVVIGDRVETALDPDGSATIEAVLPRRSEVVRKGPGGRGAKVVAANVDRLVVVAAVARPTPRQALLDRLLAVGASNHLDTALVLNKTDLAPRTLPEGDSPPGRIAPPRDLAGLYRGIGYRVLETSAVSGEGLDSLRDILRSGSSALVGPSGAGKSTLLNAVQPGLNLRTGELSHRKGRGRHTTVNARLIALECGGLVADTPGFSDVGVWGVEPRELEQCFPEFALHRDSCRFRACSHIHEPDCGVREALARGAVDPGRYESYQALVEEAGGP